MLQLLGSVTSCPSVSTHSLGISCSLATCHLQGLASTDLEGLLRGHLGESPGGQGSRAPTAAVGKAVSQHQALLLLPLSLRGTKGAADTRADFLLHCSLCLSHEISMTIKRAGCCSAESCGEQGIKHTMLGCQMAEQHWTAVQKTMTSESLSSSHRDASLPLAQEKDKTK